MLPVIYTRGCITMLVEQLGGGVGLRAVGKIAREVRGAVHHRRKVLLAKAAPIGHTRRTTKTKKTAKPSAGRRRTSRSAIETYRMTSFRITHRTNTSNAAIA